MPHLSPSVSGAIRTFSFWMANGTVGLPLLEGVDYSCIFREPSALEQVYAIFANVLELDESGNVINAKYAEKRAAHYIQQCVTSKPADPPFDLPSTSESRSEVAEVAQIPGCPTFIPRLLRDRVGSSTPR